MIRILSILVMVAALAGCASSGQYISSYDVTRIKVGVTTQEDLIRTFGPVMHTDRDEHGRAILAWGYGRLGSSQGLAVVMSEDGRAAGYHLMSGPSANSLRTILRRDAPLPEAYRPTSSAGRELLPRASAPSVMHVNASSLNVRATPVNGAIINKLARGTRVWVYASENGWARISAEGSSPEEWVSQSYLCSGPACWFAAPTRSNILPSSPSTKGYSGGACPCSSSSNCYGPRGGRYCITSGGGKRYR